MHGVAEEPTNPLVFALVRLLGLLGLRILETVGADIDLGDEHRHHPHIRAVASRLVKPH